jgi:hypothetical protein
MENPMPPQIRLYQDGFAIFALSATVLSILATASLLAWQLGTTSVEESGYGVDTASIENQNRAN